MAWDEGLLPDQRAAAAHLGGHARLLAGPGTGKTRVLTRRICFLVEEEGISPSNITVVTFTRAAARELKHRIKQKLGAEMCPHISTLHSFALRQLLKNKKHIIELPQPLRIADDWEERNIILEDLKSLAGLSGISESRQMLNKLSADWLTGEEENKAPNPQFLQAWRRHRETYGYTLRAELVYQLKEALEKKTLGQQEGFDLDGPIKHLLVDEYQDLNQCDLAVIRAIAERGAALFVAGDDDQSIYGFRKARPEGIRQFDTEYKGSKSFSLEVCRRCDRDILSISLDVIRQDDNRLDKGIKPEPGRARGEFAVLRFSNQKEEARNIAKLCSYFVHCQGISPGEILILLRSDRNGVFSRPIQEELISKNIQVASGVSNPLDSKGGRAILAFMRLAVDRKDSLAWRTLLQNWYSGVGTRAISEVYELARRHGNTFSKAIFEIQSGNETLPNAYQSRVSKAIQEVLDCLEALFPGDVEYENSDDLMHAIRSSADSLIESDEERDSIISKIESVIDTDEDMGLDKIIRAVEVVDDSNDQALEESHIKIISMHRAKGLTSKAVIVAAAEDQYIPGRAQGEEIDEERRLMYVSLTRAKHHLFVTYCTKRTGQQQHYGRNAGQRVRTLSRFLKDVPHTQAAEVEQNYNAFTKLSAEYRAENKGKFALMKSREVVALFDSLDEAYEAGKLKFPGQKFSIQEFGATLTVLGSLIYAAD